MSTFSGFVKEFPRIRIDRFRAIAGQPPPLACFLSHVHSDHLEGLETLKSPFVYCSPATRELLIRLEKRPNRMNRAKGIVKDCRQTYRDISKLLKTIPLEAPITIELGPGEFINVTLFDANHCIGACMFLIQDTRGTAILYTGDVRSERWFVNSLIQNPVLVPFSLGSRQLDCIYLDTTFATSETIHHSFGSKADGICELLSKVEQFPEDTTFYFQTWTFGYENVWIALSAALGDRVHLDPYRWTLYNSILGVSAHGSPEPKEASALCGFTCGNRQVPGCLTNDPSAKIHSCERGFECEIVRSSPNVVHIIPIITRTGSGIEVYEAGAGLGPGQKASSPSNGKDMLEYSADGASMSSGSTEHDNPPPKTRMLTFPYSRHSSFAELRELVAAFRPRDVHPCTVDEATWSEAVSMRALFGDISTGTEFAHDQMMLLKLKTQHREQKTIDSQMTEYGDNGTGSADDLDSQSAKIPPDIVPQMDSQVSGSTDFSHVAFREHGVRSWAYDAAAQIDGESWETFGGLECTKGKRDESELI